VNLVVIMRRLGYMDDAPICILRDLGHPLTGPFGANVAASSSGAEMRRTNSMT